MTAICNRYLGKGFTAYINVAQMVSQSSKVALNNSVWVIIFLFLHPALLFPKQVGII